ncbi:MAG: sensor histidine kinase [Bacteroidales bacterium]|nr:sensor histidine kinase [Bacteroidales bacterium]
MSYKQDIRVWMRNNLFNIILHSGFWALYVLLFTLLTANFLPLITSFSRVFMSGLTLALAFYFNALLLVNLLLEKKKWFSFFVLAFMLALATGMLRYYLLNSFDSSSIGFAFPESPDRLRVSSIAIQFIIIFISTFYQLILNRIRRERLNQELINRQNEAELKFLKAQINPHFLFNMLNNIYALAVTGSKNTPQMILKLSELLRYVIYGSREKKVSLGREIDHIEKFIELFQMKSENHLNITFGKSLSETGYVIEPMILIPIVENCFKHTDFDTNESAFAKIFLKLDGQRLVFTTLNSKDKNDTQKDTTGGVGLENIRKRLELLYGERFKMDIRSDEDMFELKLTITLSHE